MYDNFDTMDSPPVSFSDLENFIHTMTLTAVVPVVRKDPNIIRGFAFHCVTRDIQTILLLAASTTNNSDLHVSKVRGNWKDLIGNTLISFRWEEYVNDPTKGFPVYHRSIFVVKTMSGSEVKIEFTSCEKNWDSREFYPSLQGLQKVGFNYKVKSNGEAKSLVKEICFDNKEHQSIW